MKIFSRVFLPLALLIYISTETYLKLYNSSLCGDVGCKLAGELLKFDAIYLNYFGIIGTLFLTIFGFLSLKKDMFRIPFLIGLYSAIIFETTIISYQFIANPEPCIFCLSILSTLLLITLLYDFKKFCRILGVVVVIFIALNTVTILKNRSYIITDTPYLIQSKDCSHCRKVKKYLEEENIAYHSISIDDANARGFLKFMNINSIPALIIKDESQTVILTGDEDIINYFSEPEIPTPIVKSIIGSSSSQLDFSSNFLGVGTDEGCAITITEAPACD